MYLQTLATIASKIRMHIMDTPIALNTCNTVRGFCLFLLLLADIFFVKIIKQLMYNNTKRDTPATKLMNNSKKVSIENLWLTYLRRLPDYSDKPRLEVDCIG